MSQAEIIAGSLRRRTDAAGAVRLSAVGDWNIGTLGAVEPEARAVSADSGFAGRVVVIDLAEVGQVDTSGAWLLSRLARDLQGAGATVTIEGESANAGRLLDAVEAAAAAPAARPPRRAGLAVRGLDSIGKGVAEAGDDLRLWLQMLGGLISGVGRAVLSPRRLRITAIVNQLDRAGLRAVPIMLLMSFLIGAIIAQQGAFQLSSFGADVLVVDLVGILVLREIGVLLSAIMLAGRSGSAFTAEIGAMKMREEIDALTVIGMRPVEVLVLPRIVALVIALPLITFLADMAALAGGGLVAWLYLDIPPSAYLARLHWAIGLNTFAVGLIKAPFMALIIGIVACAEGFKVQGSTESLGRQTTAAVVKAIFMVIVVDGVFAMFFSAIGY